MRDAQHNKIVHENTDDVQCRQICDDDPACGGFSYYNKTCVPKNGVCTATNESDYTFYKKKNWEKKKESKRSEEGKKRRKEMGGKEERESTVPVPLSLSFVQVRRR